MSDKRLSRVKNLHPAAGLVRGGLAYVSSSYAQTGNARPRLRSCRPNRVRGGRARRGN